MTYNEARNIIVTNLTRVGNVRITGPKLLEAVLLVLDFAAAIDTKDAIPDWTADLTFQTDGSGAGKYCKHRDANGNLRFFETKIDDNVNNEPPTDPDISENASWEEISASAGSAIKEWSPGFFGAGLQIVYHSHSTLGRVLCILVEPVRPFSSTDIEAEINGGKWDFINLPNASETVAGKVEEATATEAQNGTAAGATGARLFINPAKLASWWTWVKTQAQTIAAMWTFSDVRITNQAAGEGTFRGLVVDENGKIIKEGNIIYDPVAKQFKLKAANVLSTGYTFVIVDSNDEVIARFNNDKSLELGGMSCVMEVPPDTESGDAVIRFLSYLSGSGIGFSFQDDLFNIFQEFRSLPDDRAVVQRQPVEYDFAKGEKRSTRQYTKITDTVAGAQHVVFEFELSDLDHYDIKVIHAEATATDNASITSLGIDCADVRKVPSTNIEGNTFISTQSRLPSSVVDGGFNWNIDTVNQKVQYRFQNVSGAGKAFVAWVEISFVRRTTPVLS